MFSLSKNGIITIDAGDSAIFTLNINAGEVLNPLTYELGDYDMLCMSVMQPNQAFQMGILRKVFYKKDVDAMGNVLIEFKPTDTQNLLPGRYTYQFKLLQVRDNEAYQYTITPPRKFIIC